MPSAAARRPPTSRRPPCLAALARVALLRTLDRSHAHLVVLAPRALAGFEALLFVPRPPLLRLPEEEHLAPRARRLQGVQLPPEDVGHGSPPSHLGLDDEPLQLVNVSVGRSGSTGPEAARAGSGLGTAAIVGTACFSGDCVGGSGAFGLSLVRLRFPAAPLRFIEKTRRFRYVRNTLQARCNDRSVGFGAR